MLIEFSVGNFRSFNEPVTLSMRAAKLHAAKKQLDEDNVFEAGGLQLLRSAAIYGANASGKSNLVQAMSFMGKFVLTSSKDSQVGEPTGVKPFLLSTATQNAPSYFQVIFYLEGVRYRYGFELDGQTVHSEWLFRTRKRESLLFSREGGDYYRADVFKEGRGLEERTRPNALFLSVVAQFNGKIATSILRWFKECFNTISGLDDRDYGDYTRERCENDQDFKKRVVDFVREADLRIADIRVEAQPLREASLPEHLRSRVSALMEMAQGQDLEETSGGEWMLHHVKTVHQVYDEEREVAGLKVFSMDRQESQGTNKIFNLSGPLLDTLDHGKVLVIDEMEARLHPFITRAIIQLFNSSQSNPHNAQLIFATHDTSVLSKRFFRRDQIWFTEKDRYGATDLYSLAEIKVRNDASFDKDYISGKYGAVPFVGGLSDLLGVADDGETT